MKKISISAWMIYGTLFMVAFLFVFLFSTTTSPLYEHFPFWFHGDSGIFQEMGVCLVQGGIPYVDLFDHKGPILWFIQALGIWINPHWGLMALQTIFLFATLVLWYKTTALFFEKKSVLFLLLFLALFFLMCYDLRGNLCEEWSLPFISWPIYLFLKNQKSGTFLSRAEALIVGLCMGIIAFIRLNNMAPFLGFTLWYYLGLMRLSKWKHLFTDLLIIFFGILTAMLPSVLFYYAQAGWAGVEEMIFGTFIFNLQYIGFHENWRFVQWLEFYIPIGGFFLIYILCLNLKKDSLNISVPAIISYVITVFSFGHRMYFHYLIIFIPLFIVALCLLLQSSSKFAFVVLGSIILQCFLTGYSAVDCLARRLINSPPNTELNDGFHRFVSSISPEERKSIYNDGLNHMGAGLFAKENLYQCNRFVSKMHFATSERLNSYHQSHGIDIMQPQWILTHTPPRYIADTAILHHYSLADSIPGGEFEPIYCLKRDEIPAK